MAPRSRFLVRGGRRAFSLVCAGLLVLVATSAQARTEVLRWTQTQANEIARWEAHVGTSSGNYTQVIALPAPQLTGGGALESSIEVDDATTVFVAIRAIGFDGRRSALSNERVRAGLASAPPPTNSGETPPEESPPEPEPEPDPQANLVPIPSPPGAYRQDFSGYPASALVGGWIDTEPEYGLGVDDSIFRVLDVSGNPALYSGRELEAAHSHHLAPGLEWTDMEMTGRMRIDQAGAGIGVTIASDYPSSDRYYRLSRSPGGPFEIRGRTSLSCSPRSTGVTPAPGIWYHYRLSAIGESGGQRIRAKVWRADEAEPASSQASCLDPSAEGSTTGTFGAWLSGDGQRYWDDFEVTAEASSAGGGGESNAPPSPPVLIRIDPVDP